MPNDALVRTFKRDAEQIYEKESCCQDDHQEEG